MKLNKELIEAIAGAYKKIGEANLEIAEYLKQLDAPSIDEVVPTVAPNVQAEAPVEVEPQEEEVEEEQEVDLESMTKKDLLALAKEYEIEGLNTKSTKAEIIEALTSEEDEEEVEEEVEEVEEVEVEDQEEVEEEETEEESETTLVVEDEDGNDVEVDLSEMNIKELKEFANEYGLEVTAKKKDGIISEILEQIYGDDEEETEEVEEEGINEEDVEDLEDEDDLAEQLGLNDMSTEELAEILEEHGLSVKGKKQALVDRVVKAIEDGTIEVEGEEEGE